MMHPTATASQQLNKYDNDNNYDYWEMTKTAYGSVRNGPQNFYLLLQLTVALTNGRFCNQRHLSMHLTYLSIVMSRRVSSCRQVHQPTTFVCGSVRCTHVWVARCLMKRT